MKKILKFGAILSIVAPMTFAVSCGNTKESTHQQTPEEKRVALEENTLEAKREWLAEVNKNSATLEKCNWIDGEINKNTDVDHIEHEARATSSSDWHTGSLLERSNLRKDWTIYDKKFTTSEYSKEVIQKDFAFMDKDLSTEIHAFINNVLKYYDFSSILAMNPNYARMNSNASTNEEKKIIIYSGADTISFKGAGTREYGRIQALTTNTHDYSIGKINAEVALFQKTHLWFNPWKIAESAKTAAGTDVLWDAVKNNKNYSAYNTKYNTDAYKENNYLAFKLLAGNIDLTPSELYEVVSASFMELDAIKMKELVKQLVSQSYKVILHGTHGGALNNISSVLLKPSIANDVHSIYGEHFSTHAAFKGSHNGKDEYHLKGFYNNSNEDTSGIMIDEYIRVKYGLLKRLDESLKDNTFKTNLLEKTFFSFPSNNLERQFLITDFEMDFYKKNNIKHVINNEYKSNESHLFGDAYGYAPSQQDYFRNIFREDLSKLDRPVYDWKHRWAHAAQ